MVEIFGYDIKKHAAAKPAEDKEPKAEEEFLYATNDLYASGQFKRYNPDVLMTNKGVQIYYQMMLDDQIKAVMRFKQYAVVSRDWNFGIGQDENGEPLPEHIEMARQFSHIIESIRGDWTVKLIGILSAMENGFSITEKVYTPIVYEDKTIWGLKDLKLRPFDSFLDGITTDPHGNITEVQQFGGMGSSPVPIPLNKIIYFVYQPDIDEVFGESDLRACYRNYWSKDIIIKFQNIFLERHASGMIVLKPKNTLVGNALQAAKNFITNLTTASGGILPTNLEIEHFQPMKTDAYEKAIAQHDKAIAKSMLVPNLLGLTEQGSTGSYAQAEIHFDSFLYVLQFITNQLQETLNEQIFREFAHWNFGTDNYPKFQFEPLSGKQKQAMATEWGNLVQKGAVTKSDPDEAWVRNLVGAPMKAEEQEVEGDGHSKDTDSANPDTEETEEPDNNPAIEKADMSTVELKKQFAEKQWLRRVNFTAQETLMDKQDVKLSSALSDINAQVSVSLQRQIIKIAGDRSFGNIKPTEFVNVAIPKSLLTKIRKASRVVLDQTLNGSYVLAAKELPKKKFKAVISPGMDKIQADRVLSSQSMQIANVVDSETLNAVNQVLTNSIKYDKTLKETIEALETDTKLVSLLPEVDAAGRAVNIPARLENIARTNNSTAVNEGRMALFGKPEFKGYIQAYEYSAILDSRTTDVCQSLHGKIRKDWAERTPPNHYQCRSILVPVTVIDEWDGKQDNIPAAGTPQQGFG